MNKFFYITAILLICFSGISIAQENNYLRVTALDNNVDVGIVNNGKIKFVIYYSINGDDNWTEFDTTKTITLTNKNDYICFKGENTKLSTSGTKFANFTFSKKVAASGSVMSLIDNEGLINTIPNNYYFCKLFFNCSTLVSAPDLTAETLTQNCYNSMFQGCTALERAPNISATSYAKGCMSYIFSGCSSLKYIEVPFTSWKTPTEETFTTSWVKDVAENGIFISPESLEPANGQSAKPTKWLFNPHKVCLKDISADAINIKNDTLISYKAIVTLKPTKTKGYDIICAAVGKNSNQELELNSNKFTMPYEDVEITLTYNPITYSISTEEYVNCEINTATVESEPIPFTVTDRTSEGYELTKVAIGTKSIPFENYAGSFNMSDFAKDVTISATYTPIKYQITKDENISCRKTTATAEDEITFTIKNLTAKGWQLKKVLVNSKEISYQDYSASFQMKEFLCNVNITAEYEPITFTISTEEYITCNTKTATVESDVITFTVTDLTSEGYELSNVKIGTKTIPIENFAGSFLMSDFAKDVTITATYSAIKYQITKDENITCRKTTATVNDSVYFTIKDYSNSGLAVENILINSKPINYKKEKPGIDMKDFKCDVYISVEYKQLDYKITTDPNITSDHQFASINDLIKIDAKDLTSDGYELEKIFVNGSSVTFYKNFSNFQMSEYKSDVEITTQYKPISYKVKAGRYVFTDKNSATVNDTIFFSVDDLSEDGRIFEHILVNGQQIDIKTFNDTIFMSDYISDITIEAVYSKYHSIKTDNNITEISHTTAQKDEQIQFKINRANAGYEPFVYVNSRRLFSPDSINYTFSMFDNDVDIYVDYQEIVVEEPETQEDNQDESEPEVIKKNRQKAINKIKVYPSLAKEGEIITISLENVDSEYLNNSKIIIFEITGKSIKTIDNPQEISKIIMPNGIYKGVFISGDKKIRFDFAILK